MVWKRKPPKIEVSEDLIFVYANNTGSKHIFDFDEDLLSILKSCAWNENGSGYLSGRVNNERTFAHWLIMPRKNGLEIDHINRDKKDNRKNNLRHLDRSNNQFNSDISVIASSGVRGVNWHKKGKKWNARIRKNRKYISLGLYDAIDEAAKVRKEAEKLYFGSVVGDD